MISDGLGDLSAPTEKPRVNVGEEGGDIQTGPLNEPVTNWDFILKGFGLDPNVFEVDRDTVRMSKWQQSKRLENGQRDLVWLYSYKAQIKRRLGTPLNDTEIDELHNRVSKYKPVAKNPSKSLSEPCSFVICWADWQLGKSAGGGVEATIDRVLKSFDATLARINDLKKIGRNIEQIVIVNMGDPVEGCDGNYASQTFTVELNQREQLRLALDLWAQGVRHIAPQAEKSVFISTISNHGEWTRRGSKPITSDSDSADAFLADTLLRILDGRPEVENMEWVIPHDQMTVTHKLHGINVAFTHGHKITGKEIEWLRGQSIRILRDEGEEPRLWVTAHKHHLDIKDYGPWTRIQCPSLDGGSKWYSDIAGQWSTPGTLTFTVGSQFDLGYGDIAIL